MASSSDPNTTPAAEAPPGMHSTLINPPNKDIAFIAAHVVAIVLSTPWVFVRMYTRKYVTCWVWWDDYTCILGWMFFVALCGMIFACIEHGGGKDIWNVSKAENDIFSKLFRDLQIVARVGMFLTKASLVLFYQRLFVPDSKAANRRTPIWWSIWFVFWWNLLYCVALILTILLDCVGQEEKKARGEQCIDEFAVLIGASVINVVTDLMLFVIPIAGIWGLQMSFQRKWRVSAIFALSFLGVAASVARLGYQIAEKTNPNSTMTIMTLVSMNTAEHFIAIVVSCMPVLPAFYRHITTTNQTPRTSNPLRSRSTSPSSQQPSKSHNSLGIPIKLKSWNLKKSFSGSGTSRFVESHGKTRTATTTTTTTVVRQPSSSGTSNRAMMRSEAPFGGDEPPRELVCISELGHRRQGDVRDFSVELRGVDEEGHRARYEPVKWDGDDGVSWGRGISDIESGLQEHDRGERMVVRRTSITVAEEGEK